MQNPFNNEELRDLWINRILVFVAVFLLGFVVVNWSYFLMTVDYLRNGQTQIYTSSNYNQLHKNDIGQPNFLQIEALHIQAPVLFATTTEENDFQALLKNGVVHYPGTAQAGQLGNVYIFGHSSDFIMTSGNYKSVFATLPNIKIDTVIKLSDATGKIYNYKVIKTNVVSPDDVSVLSQGEYKKKLLTIQTSYPVGTALERFIAVAELVD